LESSSPPGSVSPFAPRHLRFRLVVGVYHEQGHGPVKVLGIEAGTNITVGLPVIRTSVDHGTSFDIAGSGKADFQSMVEAIHQAAQMATGVVMLLVLADPECYQAPSSLCLGIETKAHALYCPPPFAALRSHMFSRDSPVDMDRWVITTPRTGVPVAPQNL